MDNKSFRRIRHGVKFTAFFFLLILTYNTCTEEPYKPEDPPQKADCPNGFLPCENDSTECCEVICPPGTYLGGPDSTDCITFDCPNGFLPCEDDSTQCCEVICPPGTLLGGQDSTECIPVECPDFHYLCGPDSTNCCPDTTSHDMTWEVDTIFSEISGYAYDVAIINDTTIWVVGKFYLDDFEDTLTSFEASFNLIRWNGESWTLDRIKEPENTIAISRTDAIFVLSQNEIWASVYGTPYLWNGEYWSGMYEFGWESVGGQIITIWGSSSDDVFFSGKDGQINHWDGSGFERMVTPTDNLITDLWGTGANNVWAVGFNPINGATTTLMHYDGLSWNLKYEGDIYDWFANRPDHLSGVIGMVYTNDPDSVKVLSNPNGIYTTTPEMAPSATLLTWDNSTGLVNMKGNASNDLFIAATHSRVFHYNGKSFHQYDLPGDMKPRRMDVKGDLVVTIGYDYTSGSTLAFIGRR